VCRACAQQARDEEALPWEREAQGVSNADAFGVTWWAAIRSPAGFFSALSRRGPLLPAVMFAVVCMTLGMLMHTVWELMFNESLNNTLLKSAQAMSAPPAAMRAISFLRVPLLIPFIFAGHVALTQLGAVLAGGERVSWATSTRIVGYSAAAYLMMIVPPLGSFPLGHMLMVIWLMHLRSAGLQRFYGLSQLRAMLVAMVTIFFGMLIGCL
jgi:hypothetical protein